MTATLEKQVYFLKLYAVFLTTAVGVVSLAAFRSGNEKPHFAEIDVERVNVVEKDGKVRMVIANKEREPDNVMNGKTYRRRGRSAGIIFYNDEGNENGGLAFGGSKGADGKPSAYGALNFDRYDQDQTVSLQYNEANGRRTSGLQIVDRPDIPLSKFAERVQALDRLPESEQAAANKALEADYKRGEFGIEATRLFAGSGRNRSAVVELSDPKGKPRLRLSVDSTGAAGLEFLDADGKVTSRLPDSSAGVAKP